jgi:hypothetical protein
MIRNYQLATLITGLGGFPSQCSSSLQPGETLIFQSLGADNIWTQSTFKVVAPATPSVVWGFHVNGINVRALSPTDTQRTTTSIRQSTTTPNFATVSVTASATSTTATTATIIGDRKASSLSAGTIAGLAISILVLLNAAIIGA